MDGWMDGWMHACMDGWMNMTKLIITFFSFSKKLKNFGGSKAKEFQKWH